MYIYVCFIRNISDIQHNLMGFMHINELGSQSGRVSLSDSLFQGSY